MNHAEARTAISTRWEGDLSSAQAEALRTHLLDCGDCRALYDRAAAVRRVAAGGSAGTPLPSETSLLLAEVMRQMRRQPEPSQAPFWHGWKWAAGIAVAALVLFVVAPWHHLPHESGPRQERVQERGAVRTLPAAGLGLSGVDRDGAEYEVVESDGICQQDFLRFYVNRREESMRHYFVFGVDELGRVHWYAPLPAERESYPLADEFGKPIAVPYQIELEHEHEPGLLVVVALFSPAPLDWNSVDALLPQHLAALLEAPAEGAEALANGLGRGVLPAVRQTRIISCGGNR